jgi:DNA-binding CsgD family transcriptional regulator
MILMDDQLVPSALTSREREILHLVAQGYSAKETAQEIGIAPRTVERHIENVRHKLRARNKSHMIAKAVSLRLLDVSKAPLGPVEGALLHFPTRIVANE